MDIELKTNNDTFFRIKIGEISSINHGYSRNKKYNRLFMPIDKIILRNALTGEKLVKQFAGITLEDIEPNKKIFKIELL